MYACNFNTDSFLAASLFIERLIQHEDNVFNLINICKNDPTLTLDLHLILEAANTEKKLEDKLGYKDRNVLSLHIILTTAIAAAIRHGIIHTIRDSPELPVVPDYIPSHFVGKGIVHYFKEQDSVIHQYGEKAPAPRKFNRYHPYQRHNLHRCSKCKRLGHDRKDCCDYQCTECQLWGPGHTTPNCPIKIERDHLQWRKEWKEASAKWEIANQRIDEEKEEPVGNIYGWNGVPDIPNSAWNTPENQPEVIDLTSPSPSPSLLPPTPPSSPLYCPFSPLTYPSPLFDLEDLVSDFDSVASSYSSLSNVGDIEF